MQLVYFILLILGSLIAMEFVAYGIHRFIFHGLLWRIHQSHHVPDQGIFELNDLFSLFFGVVSVGLIVYGSADPLNSTAYPIGIGILIYGVAYFIVHDLFTHRRFYPFNTDIKSLRILKRGHQRHHQTIDKVGQEPYGLFLFDYELFGKARRRTRKSSTSE